MNLNLAYTLGTLLTWVGAGLLFRDLLLGIKAELQPQLDLALAWKQVLFGAIRGVICLLGATAMEPIRAAAVPGSWRLPLVWFVMPFSAWMIAFCGAFVVARLVQASQAISPLETQERLKAAGIWAVGIVVGVLMYRLDPANTINVLTGGIPLSIGTALLLIGLVFACLVAMVVTARSAATRGYARGAIVQLTLIAGSCVFGLPFAYLLVTSFKEDRDMSSAHGIIWVPRVTETRDYFDPKTPLYEGEFQGQTVQGVVIETNPNGTVKVDINKPMAIRGTTFEIEKSKLKEIPRQVPIVHVTMDKKAATGFVVEDLEDGTKRVKITGPAELKDREQIFAATEVEPVRNIGLNWRNYPEALSFLPPETNNGLLYLRNTLVIVLLSIIGTVLSSSIVSYAFSRMKFPGRNALFTVLLATMMLPGAVTLLPQFLIFRSLGWIDTLYPLWVPAFFGSAFNIFLLRQFFMNIPMELEDAAKIDGCSYLETFWKIMLPQIKPALAVIFIWTFLGAWNNFMGPLIYINSSENMPLSYALQLFAGDRGAEPGLLMAFATLTMVPVLAIFFFFQRYFIEGVTLSGLGGR